MNASADSSIKIEILPEELVFLDKANENKMLFLDNFLEKAPEGTHTIKTKLKVTEIAGQIDKCTGTKMFRFATNLTTQAVEFKMELPDALKGKVYLYKVTSDIEEGERCQRVEYGNSEKKTFGQADFGVELPTDTDWVRPIFSIKRGSADVGFKVHLSRTDVLGGDVSLSSVPCDPQAGNDPPQQDPDI